MPLDASYKQYTYAPGLKLKDAVPPNGPALLAAIRQGASITPDFTQNLNLSALNSQMVGDLNQVNAYIRSHGSGPVVNQIFGAKIIRESNPRLLSDALPYSTIYLGPQAAEISDDLRWKVNFNGYALDGSGSAGKTLINQTFNLSELIQRRVGVTYEGATSIDQQSIASYRLSGASSLPAYALQVRPLFQIDGITVHSGEAIGMAQDLEWQVNVIPAGQPGQTGNLQTYLASAGDETVWAVIGDSLSAAQLSAMSFPATAAGNLHAVGMSYWHQVDAYAALIANRESARVQRMPSLGAVSSGLRVQFIWGIPRNASYTGRTIDIGHSSMGVAGMSPVAFQREQGMRTSYLEGSIFDQVFQREAGSSVSAAGLLQTATAAGLKVFTLTSANADQYLGQIQMSRAVHEEITNALLMDLEITIPEAEQNINGWQGTGYVAIRPETGAGVYIISGGLRGGAEGGDCELQPSSEPAKTTNFSPAVLFAAAIIAAYLIASIAPVAVAWVGANAGAMVVGGTVLLAVSETAVAAPLPQLTPPWTLFGVD